MCFISKGACMWFGMIELETKKFQILTWYMSLKNISLAIVFMFFANFIGLSKWVTTLEATIRSGFGYFLSILVTKRRIFFLKKIIVSFLKLSSEKRGELTAQLISSKNLTAEELKNISDELSKVVGSEINFDYKVDQNLIGGFKMQIGSLMIDTSIKNKLSKYKQIMLEN